MADDTRWNLPSGAAADGEVSSVLQDFLRHGRLRGIVVRHLDRRVILRHFLQILIRQIRQQVIHRRIFAAAFAEGDQLVIEIAGRLTRKSGEINIADTASLLTMTGHAGAQTFLDGIRRRWK
jgi:hypothetical protein